MDAIACARSSLVQSRAFAVRHVSCRSAPTAQCLKCPFYFYSEDLNLLVRRHIEGVVARGPARTISTLETDATELINTGMITLNAKLKGCEDDNLLLRIVELWGFFWDQVLPYVEGVSGPEALQSTHRISYQIIILCRFYCLFRRTP